MPLFLIAFLLTLTTRKLKYITHHNNYITLKFSILFNSPEILVPYEYRASLSYLAYVLATSSCA